MEKSERHSQEKQPNNPLNEKDQIVQRLEPSIETDSFSEEEQKEIVRMVVEDATADVEAMAEWITKRKKDLQMYQGEKPTIIENLTKKGWQSDRNLRLCTAVCDSYQSTLLATCYNRDLIHLKETQQNEAAHKDDVETFVKWGLDRTESNLYPEVDGYIHNKVVQGFAVFKVYWKVWYEWVDKRIPKYANDMKRTFLGYDIKTEKMRFEKGVIENIPEGSDILTPTFGKDLQSTSHLIHIIHLNGEDVLDYGERKIFDNVDEKYVKSLQTICFDQRVKTLGKEKAEQLGLLSAENVTHADLRTFPVDVYEWYGKYSKGNKTEQYRFTVEPVTMTFLAGKPLRKIPGCRNGKRPFVGGALMRRPGLLRGDSIPWLTADICNQFNNVWNQKSDFQYVENMPYGFHKPDENFDKQVYELEPGVSYPSEDPKNINFPNNQRSMAWAQIDFQILFEMIERVTGAASYFQSRDNQSETLGQDMLIEKNSETRFSKWVNNTILEFAEAIEMWLAMYQDCAPKDLGERILGEDGRKLFQNMSIETLRGGYGVQITPDIISGSKALEKSTALWVLQTLPQNMWLNPQINPRGNWEITVDQYKKVGVNNIEKYMPPKPPPLQSSKIAEQLWARLIRGEDIDIAEVLNPLEVFEQLRQKGLDEYKLIDEEYRPNFDNFMFKLYVAQQRQVKMLQEQQIAMQTASKIIGNAENKMLPQQPIPQPGVTDEQSV